MTDRREQLMKLYEADPSDTFVTYALAMEWAKAGEAEQAMGWIDKTIAADPDHAYAYFQKARMRISAGDAAGARQALQDAIAAAERGGDEKAKRESAELLRTLG